MDSFDQLSRIKKRTRLRKLGKTALSKFGIDRANLKLISDTTNFVFRVDALDSRYVLRVHPGPPLGMYDPLGHFVYFESHGGLSNEGERKRDQNSHPHRHQPVHHEHPFVIDDRHAVWPQSPSP